MRSTKKNKQQQNPDDQKDDHFLPPRKKTVHPSEKKAKLVKIFYSSLILLFVALTVCLFFLWGARHS